jgi:putative hydrolase of HD superfamily
MTERWKRQIEFVIEIDRLKDVFRQSDVIRSRRRENDAEHSWHMAVMAAVLAEYAEGDVDLPRVIRMLLVHDIVEIDAGDTYAYDDEGRATQAAREVEAADRIFAMLPADQGAELRALWDEFEGRRTPEARFAGALDRLQPLLLNYHTQGKAWREHGIRLDQVLVRNRPLAEGAE